MADGPKPPKGWLLTGVVLLLLSLAGCGGGALGCGAFVSDLQKAVDQGGETPLGESTTFTASGSKAAILSTAVASTDCEGVDGDGNAISFQSPGSGTSGNVSTNGQSFDLSSIFDTQNGQTYTVTCSSPSSGSGSFLVVPFPGLTSLFAGMGAIAGGVLFFMVGIICVIVGLVKRSGWKKRHGGGSGPAMAGVAGGYVPPPPGGFNPGAAPPPPGGYSPPAPGTLPQAPGGYAPGAPYVPGSPGAPGPVAPPPLPGQAPPAPGQAPGPDDTVRRPPPPPPA